MVETGYIFPGQGAQFVGMGQDLYDNHPAARQVFDKADQILDFKVTEACFKGPEDFLKKTDICQPAILTASIAALRVLKAEAGDKVKALACAGLSLGEYASLIASRSLSFEQGLKLVYSRGKYMQEACDRNKGTMASIIGLAIDQVEDICKEAGAQIANINCPGQIVISGTIDNVAKAVQLARAAEAKKVILLEVAGAFHSSLMDLASERLGPEIEEADIKEPEFKHVSNIFAQYTKAPDRIKKALIEQVNHTTRWADSINLMAADGVKVFLEIGPGKVLKGLMRRINKELEVYNINNMESLAEFLKVL